ncbi:MAG: N-acetyltransferase [Nitrospinota bacterium]|nr:N-acetyltransferase [Nitrospinota bacterium]
MKEPAETKAGTLPGVFREAVIKDVEAMQKLIQVFAERDLMLKRHANELYETVREYNVYEENGKILGLCGLKVIWRDLAEVRSLAVEEAHFGRDIGQTLVRMALDEARRLGIAKAFTLTYVPRFFEKLGFREVDKSTLPHKVWGDCVRCHKFPDCDETGMILDLGQA